MVKGGNMRNLMFYVTKDSAKEAQKRLQKKGFRCNIFRMTKKQRAIYDNIYSYYLIYEY